MAASRPLPRLLESGLTGPRNLNYYPKIQTTRPKYYLVLLCGGKFWCRHLPRDHHLDGLRERLYHRTPRDRPKTSSEERSTHLKY